MLSSMSLHPHHYQMTALIDRLSLTCFAHFHQWEYDEICLTMTCYTRILCSCILSLRSDSAASIRRWLLLKAAFICLESL